MYLVFDIGGSKMRLALSLDGKILGDPQIIPTPPSFDVGISLFEQSVKGLGVGGKFKVAAGSIAGPLDRQKSMTVNPPNLPGWKMKPLKKELEKMLGTQIYLENDADLSGLGEAVKGAGRGFDIVAYLTVSTGVGGVRVVNGKIDVNSSGFEPGHQIIDADGSIYPDSLSNLEGRPEGNLESHISGISVERRFGKKPQEITDEKVWDELAKLLAVGLNNTIVHWSPNIVVLGGGMMKTPGISVERVKYHLKNILKIFPELPEIKKAELGDVGGLHGALAYLNQLEG